jgi:hypothetical protein
MGTHISIVNTTPYTVSTPVLLQVTVVPDSTLGGVGAGGGWRGARLGSHTTHIHGAQYSNTHSHDRVWDLKI